MLVDPSGDGYYNFPHLYAEFSGVSGPYSGLFEKLPVKGEAIRMDDTWRRVPVFPKTFQDPAVKCRVHQDYKVKLDLETLKGYMKYEISLDELYAVDDRYAFLRQGDAICIENSSSSSQEPERAVEVRYIYKGPLLEYLNNHPESYRVRLAAKRQIGREVADDEQVTIVEVVPTWASQQN